jgi:hypothetical protein
LSIEVALDQCQRRCIGIERLTVVVARFAAETRLVRPKIVREEMNFILQVVIQTTNANEWMNDCDEKRTTALPGVRKRATRTKRHGQQSGKSRRHEDILLGLAAGGAVEMACERTASAQQVHRQGG